MTTNLTPKTSALILTIALVLGVSGAVVLAQRPRGAPAAARSRSGSSDDRIGASDDMRRTSDDVRMWSDDVREGRRRPPSTHERAGIITVSGRRHAGSSASAGVTVSLPAGNYRLTYAAGCVQRGRRQPWSAADLRADYANADRRGAVATVAWPNRGTRPSKRACVERYRGTGLTIHHAGGRLVFWITDQAPADNVGVISIRYERR